jgi:hypothetical protein
MRALGVRRSFRLIIRQAQDRVRFADRRLALSWPFSLREAVSGCAPDRAVTFFCFAKRKSPKKRRPDGGGRPMADCSAVLGFWGLAPNSLRSLRSLRSDSRAKSVDEACCARGPKPLCSSTPPTGPKRNTVVASQLPYPHLASHRARAKRRVIMRCAASRIWCSGPRGWRRGAQGFGGARDSAHQQLTSRRLSERRERSEHSELGARPHTPSTAEQSAAGRPPPSGRLSFGSFSLAKQRKGTALSGAYPDAASRSEKKPHANAGTGTRTRGFDTSARTDERTP